MSETKSTLRPRVYISGPVTLGDREENIHKAGTLMVELINAGFAVLCPQLTGYIEDQTSVSHDTWIDNDLPWVACADAIIRLEGTSVGADRECLFALHRGIPVVTEVEHLVALRLLLL